MFLKERCLEFLCNKFTPTVLPLIFVLATAYGIQTIFSFKMEFHVFKYNENIYKAQTIANWLRLNALIKSASYLIFRETKLDIVLL